MTQAVFFDRDGTTGLLSDDRYPETYTPFACLKPALVQLKQAGIKTCVFTNQACVARGLDRGYDFVSEFTAAGFDDWFICPHDHNDHCTCRKPKPGLLVRAAEKLGLKLSECYVVGDRMTDIMAGNEMGCGTVLVLTGRGTHERSNQNIHQPPEFVAADLMAAVEYILLNQR